MMELLNSAENVLDVLFVFQTSNEKELGLNEISRLTNINKSTVHKILKSLQNRWIIEQNINNSKYRLGVGLLQLGGLVLKELDLREVARPYMKQLAQACSNTVTLGVKSGNNLTFIERIDGRDNVRFYCDVGKITPFNGGAAAKALLAHLDSKDINEILNSIEGKKFTSKTKSKDEILSELDLIRSRGYSISDEEVDNGVLAIGAPIFGYENKAIAGMAIAGIKQTFTKEIFHLNKELLLTYSKLISKKMGYIEYL
jgi:DNA-binding IclR family transcriptional regulator